MSINHFWIYNILILLECSYRFWDLAPCSWPSACGLHRHIPLSIALLRRSQNLLHRPSLISALFCLFTSPAGRDEMFQSFPNADSHHLAWNETSMLIWEDVARKMVLEHYSLNSFLFCGQSPPTFKFKGHLSFRSFFPSHP